jgi:hypothetical protein
VSFGVDGVGRKVMMRALARRVAEGAMERAIDNSRAFNADRRDGTVTDHTATMICRRHQIHLTGRLNEPT